MARPTRLLGFARKASLVVLGACLACGAPVALHADGGSCSTQGATPALTQPQLEKLLEAAGRLAKEYTSAFKELIAEEVKTFQLLDDSGKITRQRRIVSDFVVYQSQQDPARTVEYRDVREVDGASVSGRELKAEKAFVRAAKAGSVAQELDRINREGTRYDFGYNLTGYTIHKGLALYPGVRQSFRFEVTGREQVGGHDALVINFEQTGPRSDLFDVDLPKELKGTNARLRGRLWIEAGTGQLVREHHEIVFDSPYAAAGPLVLIGTEYDFAPSDFGIWLPRQVTLSHYKPLKLGKDRKDAGMYRSARAVSEYKAFQRFQVNVGEEKVSPSRP